MIIKSEKSKDVIIALILITIWFLYEVFFPPKDIFPYIMFPPLYFTFFWCSISTDKTLIMDSEGCTICYGPLKKKYMWDEFSVKCIVRFRYDDALGNQRREGVVFSKYKAFRPLGKFPSSFSYLRPPISYFCVFFSTNEPWICWGRNIEKIFPVEEEEFMEKMQLWHVELEDCRK